MHAIEKGMQRHLHDLCLEGLGHLKVVQQWKRENRQALKRVTDPLQRRQALKLRVQQYEHCGKVYLFHTGRDCDHTTAAEIVELPAAAAAVDAWDNQQAYWAEGPRSWHFIPFDRLEDARDHCGTWYYCGDDH